MLHYTISLDNLVINNIGPKLICFWSKFFSFCNLLCVLIISLPVQKLINPVQRKIPQPGIASSYFGKRKQRYFCSSSTQVMNKHPPKFKMLLWPQNVPKGCFWCADSNHLERAARTTMQAAFFGNFLKSTLENHPWLWTMALKSKQLLFFHLTS